MSFLEEDLHVFTEIKKIKLKVINGARLRGTSRLLSVYRLTLHLKILD